ncbi:hypothetical protein [Paractinoplanes atraurantiacus]|uniref:hypothetical protein n=1 Tax=Paractinoplanes atraurantiacus TaxID=1036182 RepID=UPI001FEC51BB|nr:hypothetical protein [Actinoplanes atraurantiacus]
MEGLEGLSKIPAARARLDAEELELINQARRAGATWSDIAGALGLSSRQAAEQRRLRLAAAAARPAGPEEFGDRVAALRAAAVEVYRRIGADRRWDRRFTRAALVRDTLATAAEAPAGALFSLAEASVDDLSGAAGSMPGPTRAAITRLREALEAAKPQA